MPVGPELDAVAHQRDHARDPKARERQHQHERAVPLIQQRQVRRVDPLRKHLARERLGQLVANARHLRAMDHRARRQPRQPVLSLLLQHQAHRQQPLIARRRLPRRLVTDPQHVVLKHRARQPGRRAHLRRMHGQPLAEIRDPDEIAAHRPRRRVRQQPRASPALGRLLQPRLADPLEVDELLATIGGDQVAVRQLRLAPHVPLPQRLPAPRRGATIDHTQRLGAHPTRSATLSSTPRSASTARRSSAVGCV